MCGDSQEVMCCGCVSEGEWGVVEKQGVACLQLQLTRRANRRRIQFIFKHEVEVVRTCSAVTKRFRFNTLRTPVADHLR